MKKLDHEDLKKVVGGFQETNKRLPTKGLNVVCPRCHSSKANSFSQGALYDESIGTVEYQCKCGCSFVVYHGQVMVKNDFLSLCKEKGISYPFV